MKEHSPIGRHAARRYVLWRTKRFLQETPTVRSAASVIVTANVAIVLVSAVAIRVFDAKDFPNIWLSLWWAVQTATTVGYGDVTPHEVTGRIIGAVVMLEGIAFLAVITAAITSTFVARAQHDLAGREAQREGLNARFDELERRLDALARALQGSPPSHDAAVAGSRLDPGQDSLQEERT
jgi:voltage-gated potassium channel